MIRVALRTAICGVAILLGGCLVSQYEHFDVRKGIDVYLADGTYTCSKEKGNDLEGAPGHLYSLVMHAQAFRGRLTIQKIETSGSVRYLVAQLSDPTVATVYAFHPVAHNVFAYTAAVTPAFKSAGPGFVVGLVSITDRTIVPLGLAHVEKVRQLAEAHGVESSKERLEVGVFGLTLNGSKEDERRFIDALAASDLLKPDSVCSKVEVPATK